jgi:hypothetical protein
MSKNIVKKIRFLTKKPFFGYTMVILVTLKPLKYSIFRLKTLL